MSPNSSLTAMTSQYWTSTSRHCKLIVVLENRKHNNNEEIVMNMSSNCSPFVRFFELTRLLMT